MRLLTALISCLAVATPLWAQQAKPAQPVNLNPVLDPKNSRLDHHLLQWEQRMTGVESILCQCQREDKDKASGFKKLFKGEARYLKPNYVALRLIQEGNEKNYELFLSTGQFLYEYRPSQKTLRIHELPPPQAGGAFQNNFMSFVFGMSAKEAKQRYDLNLSKDISADNPHYIYIDVRPRFEADKKEFTRAQLVLFSQTMLPRRLWFEHPNFDQTTWDITQIDTTTKVRPVDFTPPEPPEGWQKVRVPRADLPGPADANPGAPRIVRPSKDK
jgi:TIGR03009 family protein